MNDLWNRLRAYLDDKAPEVLKTLHPPATRGMVDDAESALDAKLPEDLVESLMVHDGQLQETGRSPHAIPLAPAEWSIERQKSLASWGELAPLEHIVQVTKMYRNIPSTLGEFHDEWFSGTELIGPVKSHVNFIMFIDAGTGDSLGLDLDPAEQGQVGQVVAINHDPPENIWLANSYRDWFETLVMRYESGRYVFRREAEGQLMAIDSNDPDPPM